jgi:NADH dehydrogenase
MRPPSPAREPRHRVLIVGGGFGGLAVARALRRAPVDVTLVDRTNHHLFQPLLYQVASGILTEGEIAPPLRGVLRRQANARVLLAEVGGFDLGARAVHATGADGEPLRLDYDTLVVAAGASTAYFGHGEWEARAPSLKTLADARRVRSRVLAAFERAELTGDSRWITFAVVGGGPTGVELAGQVAELARRTLRRDFAAIDTATARITLVEAGPDILPAYPESLRARATRDLDRLGVNVRTGAPVLEVEPDGVEIAGRHVPARTVLWAAGVAASPLAAALAEAAGLEVDAAGRLPVAADLTLPGHPEVLALGDMVALDGVPGIAPAAMQQGRHAARTLRRRLAGQAPAGPFRYRDKGTLAVIGRGRAVGVSAGIRFSGALAFLVWAVVHVRYLVGWGNRLITVMRWTWSLLARNRGERVIDAPAAVRPHAVTGTSS